MKYRLLFVFLIGLCGVAAADQTCTFIADGMGGGQMFCSDPDAELSKTLQLIQQLQRLKTQQLQAQQRLQAHAAAAASQEPQRPSVTQEQVKAQSDCFSQVSKSPEAIRVIKIFGSENGFHAPKELSSRYGTKTDKNSAAQFVLRTGQCMALLPDSESDDVKALRETYMLFIAGLKHTGRPHKPCAWRRKRWHAKRVPHLPSHES